MRYAPDQKSRTRESIVTSARRGFLARGFSGVGVDAIMKSAGMTAGGFYAHFESKQHLFTLALDEAFESSMRFYLHGLDKLAGSDVVGELTRRYLSRAHRDHVDDGCPMSPLGADVARLGAEAQQLFEARIGQLLAVMMPALPARPNFSPTEQALSLLALYAGGLMLSRAVSTPALSDKMLLACRKAARDVGRLPAKRSAISQLPPSNEDR